MKKEFILLHENPNLIHGALKKAHIKPTHPDYQDFYQEAILIFCDAKKVFPEDINPNNKQRFLNYAFQRIYWQTLNQLQKNNTHEQHQLSLDTPENHLSDYEGNNPLPELIDYFAFNEKMTLLWCVLDENEKHYIYDSILLGLTISQMAAKQHCSRQTLYNRRNKIALKYLTCCA